RAFAEFSEPHFYGNEIVGVCILGGAVIDWIINKEHGLSGLAGEYLPAILLSQFIAAGVGIFLYARKFDNGGWYGTYVPVVSAAPWCVLAFGAGLLKVIFISVLSGILGAPIASSLGENLPEGIHIFIANVMAMAITTAIVWAVMDMIPWF
ncbi:MAG: hypothetical protein LBP78_03840, partial [Acidaminococcales bacterium]|nr:hypothetical protein [Acidaminococcales bacterium]